MSSDYSDHELFSFPHWCREWIRGLIANSLPLLGFKVSSNQYICIV